MKQIKKIQIATLSGIALPFFAYAQQAKSFQQISTELIITGSNYILTLLVALTLLTFLYGLMKYMYKGQESDQARSEGRKLMLWGIIGLFVMTSIWGLVALLSGLIGHDSSAIPQFKTSGLIEHTDTIS